ncbi:hypothetical protein FQA39_LY11118 [Lamprigera yunnana]|nr:hypothetical protein FQA39_LY11118 [Lamprigera yunnana]
MRSDIIKTGTLRMIKHLREKFDEESEYQIRDNSLYLNVIQFPDRHALTRTRFLSLGMRNLTGIPNSVFEDSQFAEVNIVDLCKNQLTAVPEGLVLLKNKLTELNLSANKLKIIPDFLSACTSLHFLDVSKNALRDLPDGMGNLKRMREIIISNNKFQSIPECIYELKGLEVLNATDNMISEIDVSNLKKLKRLATLALTNNNINFVPPELGTLTHLRSLELVGNSFRQPRYTVLEQGTESILSYLRNRIQQ